MDINYKDENLEIAKRGKGFVIFFVPEAYGDKGEYQFHFLNSGGMNLVKIGKAGYEFARTLDWQEAEYYGLNNKFKGRDVYLLMTQAEIFMKPEDRLGYIRANNIDR